MTTEVAMVGGAVDRGVVSAGSDGSAAVSVIEPAGEGRGRICGGEEVTGLGTSATEAMTSAMMLEAVSTVEVVATGAGEVEMTTRVDASVAEVAMTAWARAASSSCALA